MSEESTADLHVHSKYSDDPSEWFLKCLGVPESFVEPLELYRTCRKLGFDYVTITDHNRIEGALEIAHLPGTFISSELTATFPEDGCKVHCLVYGVTEKQFQDIDRARHNIYELVSLVREQDIICSLAHPFYQVTDDLKIDHLEKLLLLFDRFESLNGNEHPASIRVFRAIAENLTPDMLAEMADRQGIEPVGERPWEKKFTGGSDDHSGQYIGTGYTRTPHAESTEQFLDFLREGEHRPAGEPSSRLQYAHRLYHAAYDYYRTKAGKEAPGQSRVLRSVFKLVSWNNSRQSGGLRAKFGSVAFRALCWLDKHRRTTFERNLIEGLPSILERAGNIRGSLDLSHPNVVKDANMFGGISSSTQHFARGMLEKVLEFGYNGNIPDCVQTCASLSTLVLAVAPYIASFDAVRKYNPLIHEAACRFGHPHLSPGHGRTAWIGKPPSGFGTFALSDDENDEQGLAVLTCGDSAEAVGKGWKNFEPVGDLQLPGENGLSLPSPPFLEICRFIAEADFGRLLIGTADAFGLSGLLASRLLGLKCTCVYHTDFASGLREAAPDEQARALVERYEIWLLDQADEIQVRSAPEYQELVERGVDAEKLIMVGDIEDILARADEAKEEASKENRRNPRLCRVHISLI